jgi:hydrogenase nickel incorporation protein HypA/HybF
MHELSLMRSMIGLIEESARRERFARVLRIRLEVGALCNVELKALEFCFDLVARGTLAERARFEVQTAPARRSCAGCGREAEITSRLEPCPGCGEWTGALDGGDRIAIRELEVE